MMKSIAHIRNEDKAIQTVEAHLNGVEQLASEFGAKIGASKLAGIAGLLHDVGKYNEAFQEYIIQAVYNPENPPKKGSVDHSTAGGKYIYDLLYTQESTLIRKLIAEVLGNVIISHHMGLQDFLRPDLSSDYLYRVTEKELPDYKESISQFTSQILTTTNKNLTQDIQEAEEELKGILKKDHNKQHDKPNIELTLSFITKYIFSCLIDADRTNTRLFEENKLRSPQLDHKALFDKYYSNLMNHVNELTNISDQTNHINQLRSQMSEQCDLFGENKSGVYTLSIPTGGGKTIASMRYALKHAVTFNKERIIYVAPYTTIIEQNAIEIKCIFQDDKNILEHHSNVIQEIDEKDENYAKNKALTLAKDNWDAPVIFTTMVQFLNNVYAKGTRNSRRLHNMANAIIIFDEVQSVPIKCISLFNEAVNFLKNTCNTSVLLCTATQPALEHLKNGLDQIDGEIIRDLEHVTRAFKRVEISDQTTEEGWSTEELTAFIISKTNHHPSILCVLNTKTVVRKLFERLREELDDDVALYHLSTSMCAAHRTNILAKVKEKLRLNEKVICLSTQLIEAGVDISFNAVIRSLSGLDSIAQAAGRCNRHGENELGNVFIFKHKEEHLTHLKTIATGAEITHNILRDKKGENLDALLSNEVISFYFKQFYHQLDGELDYPIPKLQDNLMNLLKGNSTYKKEYEQSIEKPFPLFNFSSIKTVAKYFQVIDKQATTVIVPYGMGEELIADLNGDLSIEDMSLKLKQAQQYTIDIFEHEKRGLIKSGDLISLRDGYFLALRDNAYDKRFGLHLEGEGQMDSLQI